MHRTEKGRRTTMLDEKRTGAVVSGELLDLAPTHRMGHDPSLPRSVARQVERGTLEEFIAQARLDIRQRCEILRKLNALQAEGQYAELRSRVALYSQELLVRAEVSLFERKAAAVQRLFTTFQSAVRDLDEQHGLLMAEMFERSLARIAAIGEG
jgi:hypothetical protein